MTEPEAMMSEAAALLVDGVERLGAAWVVRAVTFIVDAYDRLDAPAREHTLEAAHAIGPAAAARVASDLRALFVLDPADQHATPLEIIRTLRYEVTGVLEAAGIPAVERDQYETRAFPDDMYGIVPKSVAELGDDELGGALIAWGMSKARVLRERAESGQGG